MMSLLYKAPSVNMRLVVWCSRWKPACPLAIRCRLSSSSESHRCRTVDFEVMFKQNGSCQIIYSARMGSSANNLIFLKIKLPLKSIERQYVHALIQKSGLSQQPPRASSRLEIGEVQVTSDLQNNTVPAQAKTPPTVIVTSIKTKGNTSQ